MICAIFRIIIGRNHLKLSESVFINDNASERFVHYFSTLNLELSIVFSEFVDIFLSNENIGYSADLRNSCV